jgi:hypothetical protein
MVRSGRCRQPESDPVNRKVIQPTALYGCAKYDYFRFSEHIRGHSTLLPTSDSPWDGGPERAGRGQEEVRTTPWGGCGGGENPRRVRPDDSNWT